MPAGRPGVVAIGALADAGLRALICVALSALTPHCARHSCRVIDCAICAACGCTVCYTIGRSGVAISEAHSALRHSTLIIPLNSTPWLLHFMRT
jgi:hypothetical protein